MATGDKMNIRFRIKAVDDFSRNMKKLNTQLNQVKRSVEDLPEMRSVQLDADTEEFNMAISEAKANLDGLPEREGVTFDAHTTKFNTDVNQAENNVSRFPNTVTTYFKAITSGFARDRDKLANTLRSFGEITQGFGGGALRTFLPALSPIIGVLVGGLGAIASSFSAAGLGAAGFASVAIPAISGVLKGNEELKKAQEAVAQAGSEEERAKAMKELEKVQQGLNGTQMDSIKALREFKSFFSDFAKDFQPDVLRIFQKSLKSLKGVLELAKPGIKGATDAMNNLMDAFNRNLKSDDVRKFFEWLGKNAGPHLESTIKALGNFVTGIGNMLVAFDPLADSFSEGFLNMSKDFRKWTKNLDKNKSFQDFMKFVEKNAPTVLSLFGNIIDTIVNFGESASPATVKILEMADGFFKWTANLMKNEKWVANVIAILTAVSGVLALLMPFVVLFSSTLRILWPIIKRVWGWFKKLKKPLKELGTKIKNLWPKIKTAAKWIWRIGGKLKWLLSPIALVIGIILFLAGVIWKNWKDIKNWVVNAVDKISKNLKEGWRNMKENVSNATTKIKNNVTEGWKSIKKNVSEFVSGIWKNVKEKFSDMVKSVKTRMGNVWDEIKSTWNDVTGFLEDINLFSIGANIIEGLKDGVKSMGGDLVDSVKGTVDRAIQGAKNLLGIASPSKVFEQIGVFTGQGMVKGMNKMRKGVTSASSRMAKASVPSVTKNGLSVKGRDYEYTSRNRRTSQQNQRNNNESETTLLSDIRDELRNQRNMIVEMDNKEVGKVVEPEITTIQGRQKRRKDAFS